MTYTFTFPLGSDVTIKALKQTGSIEGVRLMGLHDNEAYLHEEYFVTYWIDGKHESAWLYRSELKENN